MRFCSAKVRASSALMSSRAFATLGFARIAWENISTADVVICARALLTSESTSRRAMELDKRATDRLMATSTRRSRRIGTLTPRRRLVEPRSLLLAWKVVLTFRKGSYGLDRRKLGRPEMGRTDRVIKRQHQQSYYKQHIFDNGDLL